MKIPTDSPMKSIMQVLALAIAVTAWAPLQAQLFTQSSVQNGTEGTEPIDEVAIDAEGNIRATTGTDPRLRLSQDNSDGNISYTWDIAANDAGIGVLDAETSLVPFLIEAGAPDLSLLIDSSGEIHGNGSQLSNVDAETVDGQDANAFMSAGTDEWVNESGDSMTGDLNTTGHITASSFSGNHIGDGSGLTNLPASPLQVNVWEAGTDNIVGEGESVRIAELDIPGEGVLMVHVWISRGQCALSTSLGDSDLVVNPFEQEETVLMAHTVAGDWWIDCTGAAGGGNFQFMKGFWIPADVNVVGGPLPQ